MNLGIRGRLRRMWIAGSERERRARAVASESAANGYDPNVKFSLMDGTVQAGPDIHMRC